MLAFERLLSILKELKHQTSNFPDAENLRIGVNLAWEKLDKYCRLFNEILYVIQPWSFIQPIDGTDLRTYGKISPNGSQERRA
jgi:hypothetical protein